MRARPPRSDAAARARDAVGPAARRSPPSAAPSPPGAGGKKRKSLGAGATPAPAPAPRLALTLVLASNDQTLSFVSLPALALTKSVAGYNDAFTDVRYIPGPHAALVASTNSEQVRLLDPGTMDTRLLNGHSGSVLSVSPSPDGLLVASASKDGTARVWDLGGARSCVAVL